MKKVEDNKVFGLTKLEDSEVELVKGFIIRSFLALKKSNKQASTHVSSLMSEGMEFLSVANSLTGELEIIDEYEKLVLHYFQLGVNAENQQLSKILEEKHS